MWGGSHYHVFENVKVRTCFLISCEAALPYHAAASVFCLATAFAQHRTAVQMTKPFCLCLQLDWAGDNEFGVYFYHPANETIPESQRIQPKVCLTTDAATTVTSSARSQFVGASAYNIMTGCSTADVSQGSARARHMDRRTLQGGSGGRGQPADNVRARQLLVETRLCVTIEPCCGYVNVVPVCPHDAHSKRV